MSSTRSVIATPATTPGSPERRPSRRPPGRNCRTSKCCVASRTTRVSRSNDSSRSIPTRRSSSRAASTSSGGRRAGSGRASAGSSARARPRWTRRPCSGRPASSVRASSSPTTPTTGRPRPHSSTPDSPRCATSTSRPLVLGMLHALRGECDVFNGDPGSGVARTEAGLEISSRLPGHVGPRVLLVERGVRTAGARGRGRRDRVVHAGDRSHEHRRLRHRGDGRLQPHGRDLGGARRARHGSRGTGTGRSSSGGRSARSPRRP